MLYFIKFNKEIICKQIIKIIKIIKTLKIIKMLNLQEEIK